MSKNRYVDKYLENRKHVTLTDQVCGQLDLIKKNLGLKSNNDAVQYLIDLEKEARKKGVIEETKICSDCGAAINVNLADYTGITHGKIDRNSDCFGCIKTKFGLKNIKDKEIDKKDVKKMTQEEFDKVYEKDENGLYHKMPDHF